MRQRARCLFGRLLMRYRRWIGPVALVVMFATASAAAQSSSDSKYPEWKGQWVRIGAGTYDPDKRSGGQPPPLTAEYEAIWEANRAEEAAGGQYRCSCPIVFAGGTSWLTNA